MLNPWAALVILAAILCIIIAWKGTQDNVLSAVLGRSYGNNTLYNTPTTPLFPGDPSATVLPMAPAA